MEIPGVHRSVLEYSVSSSCMQFPVDPSWTGVRGWWGAGPSSTSHRAQASATVREVRDGRGNVIRTGTHVPGSSTNRRLGKFTPDESDAFTNVCAAPDLIRQFDSEVFSSRAGNCHSFI